MSDKYLEGSSKELSFVMIVFNAAGARSYTAGGILN